MVEYFNRKVLGLAARPMGMMPKEEFELSLKQLREELQEIEDAYNRGDFVGIVDGLIDLDYFHKGVVYKHGITPHTYNRCFRAVHEANLKKRRSRVARDGSSAADAVKPDGWVPPEREIQNILDSECPHPPSQQIIHKMEHTLYGGPDSYIVWKCGRCGEIR